MEKQTKTWVIRGLLLLIILTMSCTCMPGNNNNNNKETEVAVVEEVAEVDESSTPIPTNTVMVEPTDTVEPTLDEAVLETELAALMEEYNQTRTREWSAPAYPDSEYLVDERDGDPTAEDIVTRDARIFSLTEPFYYEFYTMPSGLRYADVQEFFKKEIPKLGYKFAEEKQGGGQEIYLITFVDDSSSPQRKIVIEYWREGDLLLLLYKNPE